MCSFSVVGEMLLLNMMRPSLGYSNPVINTVMEKL